MIETNSQRQGIALSLQFMGAEAMIKSYLSESRMAHSLRVAQTARELARHWQLDEARAYDAGLYHDIAKEQHPDRLKALGVSLPAELIALYEEYPKIWHAFAGPIMLQQLSNINDNLILDAVKWHTTGKAAMAPLEKIIYVADYIEPGRHLELPRYAAELAIQNLDQTLYAISHITVLWLQSIKRPVYFETRHCLDYYNRQLTREDVTMINAHIDQIILKTGALK